MKRENIIYTLSCFEIASYKDLRKLSDVKLLELVAFIESQIGRKVKIKSEV